MRNKCIVRKLQNFRINFKLLISLSMFNCVQKSFVIKLLRFLRGVFPVDLMLANYNYVVLEVTFFFPIPCFYLRTSCVKNRKQKEQQQKKNQCSYLSPFAIEDILLPLDFFPHSAKEELRVLAPLNVAIKY